jgi:hypothetical protein
VSENQNGFYTLTVYLQANETYKIGFYGNYVYCTQSSAAFNIYVNDSNKLILAAGLGVDYGIDFTADSLRIENGAVAQSITLYMGQGKMIDNRLVGSISLSGGGLPFQAANNFNNGAVSVTTANTQLKALLTNRSRFLVENLGPADIFVGVTGVTTVNGFKVPANSVFEHRSIGALFAVTSSGTADVRLLEDTV